MILDSLRKIIRSEHLILLPIMALAFYMAFIPHRDYPYAVHIDEWVHMAYSQAILQAHDTTFVDPFLGQSTLGLSTNLETGFQLFWAVFYQISGLSWMTIFRYFPGIISMMIALSVYVLARREGFGWEAAFFATLIPTRVGIMGPAFLVPVGMGLLFVPQAFFLAFNLRTWRSYLALFALISFVVAMHPPSALLLILALAPFIVLNLKDNYRHSLSLSLALSFPFLVALPWISQSAAVKDVIANILTPKPLPLYHELLQVTQSYGYLPILFTLMGAFLLAMRGGRKNYGLVLGLLVLQLMLVTYFAFHYGDMILYVRGFHYMMLMAAITAGAGLMALRRLEIPGISRLKLKAPLASKAIGLLLCLGAVGLTLVIAIPDRYKTPYYHMIDQEDYQAFVWIRDSLGENYGKVILHPWKATAFTAITGKQVYTRIHTSPQPIDNEATDFLRNGSTDTDFLRKNNITIVYTLDEVNNPDLREMRKNVYLLVQSPSE